MGRDTFLTVGSIAEMLRARGFSAGAVELYRENGPVTTYLIDGHYILKLSTHALSEQIKQERVKSLRLAPQIHASGTLAFSGREYRYALLDYVPGEELWSALPRLTVREQCTIGGDIA